MAAAYDVQVEHSGPNPVAWRPIKGAHASSMVSGAAVTLDRGAESLAPLRTGLKCPVDYPSNYCRDGPGFLLKSRDGHWLLADAPPRVVHVPGGGAELHVTSTALNGTAPVGVSYGYIDWPLLTVYSTSGLPMPPFLLQTDSIS